ncbi:MAG: hypothetical protein MRECE_32c006 [Mycoplasmataceae bacterium CE_OT135]|nr:MAG: hypothetical protein MRECE_32c006 [Mycoplasmataceae bacterium CE_OT135]
MVAYEVISGLPPYPDLPHTEPLAIHICNGLRPRFNIKIPQLLKKLIERCWDAEPQKRPTAGELNRTLNNWIGELNSQRNTEFFQQFKEREQFLNNLVSLDYKIHPSAFYTSRRLDFENLPEPRNSKETNDLFYSGDSGQNNLEIPAGLDQLSILEENQQSQQQAQILQKEPHGLPGSSKK